MNEYDSAKMREVLMASHGVELVTTPESADVLLMNTCSVREKAQEKVFSELGRWKPLKQANPKLVIGVGGCVASQEAEAIQRRTDYVDMVFGPQTLHRLPEMLEAADQGRRVVDVSFPEIEKFDNLPEPRAEGPKAFVSIMEGCSRYCTFCVVPYTRGEEISRPARDVLTEIESLARQGVREITLLGQNVNAYRGDLPNGGGYADLALLIRMIDSMDDIARIRFTTSHPVEFSDSLIAAYAEVPKLVDHLHLPVQTGSNRILNLMKRGHTRQDYVEKIHKLRLARPNVSLSSDFIVGFPGETDEDFESTMSLIDELKFDHSFSFIYSPRPGTPASDLPDSVSMETKKERLRRLQTAINEHAGQVSRKMIGLIEPVLVEGVSKKDYREISGRTSNNRIVNFPGDPHWLGRMVDVVITDALPNSLRGRVVAHSGATTSNQPTSFPRAG